ncbi:unnamed protein product [Brachionus calyciflorus]|uniref:Uncharacterized protein n=1 Tax=Brachionus calyciflorus TaxID=104777 RepID=A0A813MPJ4_9BILA|nr:unnamed protein product [Brachionus calyciflorus]
MANNQHYLLDLLNRYINKSEDFVDDLKELRRDINSHRCQTAKTVGTTVSMTGAAFLVGGLLAAPFTGGGSLILAGYGGVVVPNLFVMRELSGELKRHLDAIQDLANALVKQGIEEKTAIFLAVFNVANKGRSIFCQARDIASIAQTIKTGYLAQGGNIGYFLAARGMKSLDSFGSTAFILGKWGIRVSKGTVQTVMNSVTVVLAVWDLVSLIKGWDEKHPSSIQVTKLIGQIEKELVDLRELRDLFRSMKS